MEIEIKVKDEDGETIVKRTALSFESAYEDLWKLERYIQKIKHDEFMKLDDDEL